MKIKFSWLDAEAAIKMQLSKNYPFKELSVILLILITILSHYSIVDAQANSFGGTIDDSSPCFLYLPGFATSWHPYDSVSFRVPIAGSYSFSVSATTISTAVWFYLYEGAHDPTQNYNQTGFLAVASNTGYNGGVITVNLSPNTTYIMATNNDQNFSTQAACETRASTIDSGTYTLSSSLPILLPPYSSPSVTTSPVEFVMPPDDRINWQYGDLYAVLYHGTDEAGAPTINVYCWSNGRASLGMQVGENNYSNMLQAESCNVRLYLLENGHFQFNIYYGEKRYEIECADFECANPEMRYYDPNE